MAGVRTQLRGSARASVPQVLHLSVLSPTPPPHCLLLRCPLCNTLVPDFQFPTYRIQNLELLQEYGSTVWKSTNEILVKMLEAAQNQLQDIRKRIQDINWQRKNEQIEAGTKMKNLEDRSVSRSQSGRVFLTPIKIDICLRCIERKMLFRVVLSCSMITDVTWRG